MIALKHLLTFLTLISINDVKSNDPTTTMDPEYYEEIVQEPKLPFREYMEWFEPKAVWDRIAEPNDTLALKDNRTVAALIDGMDEADHLLSLNVVKSNPTVVKEKNGRRRWFPPGRIVTRLADTYSLRPRILGLIQTAIYQARNAMTMMQRLRDKYRNNSVYKMGYLMSKTDNACKVFHRFANLAFRYCSLYRHTYAETRTKLRDLLHIEEKQLNLWFDVELLVDLVKLNDENCREMMIDVHWERKEKWQFVD